MSVTVATSGTLTLSSSEQSIGGAQTTAGIYVAQVDLSNLAAGDIVELYVYTKILSGSTARYQDKVTFMNAQGLANFQTIPYPAPYSVEFKLKQPTGTGRSVNYAILSL